ncbi:MAG: translesion DNA synthesis-associated protein ImuA [Rubrivivax sp.]|nr:translesion DNA synthesis-associated protein ImuA [Rubrivivax sp.]
MLPTSAEALHPALWRASQLGRPRASAYPSGFAALDALLPGGGWPSGVLTELLLPHPGVGELRLLAPVLARLQQECPDEPAGRCVMWFDPPALPCPWAIEELGLVAAQMVLVRSGFGQGPGSGSPRSGVSGPGRQRVRQLPVLWALEHALKSGHAGAVLAWLPARLPTDALRRLQLAVQAHAGPAFVLRGDEAARQASPAPLRLQLCAAAPDWLRVHVLKRRGPPPSHPLLLQLQPVLAAPAQARALAGTVADKVEGVALAGAWPAQAGWEVVAAPPFPLPQRPQPPQQPQQPQGSWA